jgi:hypothetical protein
MPVHLSKCNVGYAETLVVEVTRLSELISTKIDATDPTEPLLICSRCESPAESVVAILRIPALEQTWVVCGTCLLELSAGFIVA